MLKIRPKWNANASKEKWFLVWQVSKLNMARAFPKAKPRVSTGVRVFFPWFRCADSAGTNWVTYTLKEISLFIVFYFPIALKDTNELWTDFRLVIGQREQRGGLLASPSASNIANALDFGTNIKAGAHNSTRSATSDFCNTVTVVVGTIRTEKNNRKIPAIE